MRAGGCVPGLESLDRGRLEPLHPLRQAGDEAMRGRRHAPLRPPPKPPEVPAAAKESWAAANAYFRGREYTDAEFADKVVEELAKRGVRATWCPTS